MKEPPSLKAQRGGSHVIFANDALEVNSPQREIDQALVQTVHAHIGNRYKDAFARGDVVKGKMQAGIRRFAIDCGRTLASNPFKTLSSKQRDGLIRCLPPEKKERFLKPGTPPVPEVLKNLPMKPPQRRRTDEDE